MSTTSLSDGFLCSETKACCSTRLPAVLRVAAAVLFEPVLLVLLLLLLLVLVHAAVLLQPVVVARN